MNRNENDTFVEEIIPEFIQAQKENEEERPLLEWLNTFPVAGTVFESRDSMIERAIKNRPDMKKLLDLVHERWKT